MVLKWQNPFCSGGIELDIAFLFVCLFVFWKVMIICIYKYYYKKRNYSDNPNNITLLGILLLTDPAEMDSV